MPLLWISLFFVLGLVMGFYVPWIATGWLLAGGLCLFAWPLLRRLPDRTPLLSWLGWPGHTNPRLFLPPILLLAALFFGAARIAFNGPDLANGHVAAYNDRGSFRLQAVVDAPPDRRDRSTLLRLRVEQAAPINKNGKAGKASAAKGLVLALLPAGADYQYGDRLLLSGKPVTPPEGEEFSYRDYLARQDVYTYLSYPIVRRIDTGAGNPLLALIYRFRDWAYTEIYHLFPAPEAPLLAGILLGMDGDLSKSLTRAFQDTGTAHVIAISGFNIAILSALFSNLFGKIVSRWWAALLAILAITFYTLLVGATPSVVRAAIMGSLGLIAAQIGRRSTVLNGLAFTAALMCLNNPRLPWDASFQLSFGATLGLIVYGDSLQQNFLKLLERKVPAPVARQIAGPVGDYVLLTLAAQIMTLPVILYHFQRLSISSLLANPLILPPQPMVMVLSGLAVLAGLVCDPLAHLLAWLAWPFSAYTIHMVETLARIPGGVLALGSFDLSSALLLFAATLAPLFGKFFTNLWKNMLRPGILLTGVILIAALTWRAAFAAPDGRLHLLIFDLDGSQVMLVRTPKGQRLLINGSSGARLLNDSLDRWLSPFDRHLDGLVINTTRASSLSGLPGTLETHALEKVWWGCTPPNNRTTNNLTEFLQAEEIESHELAAGEALLFGEDARLEVLSSSTTGSALRLSYGKFRVLIPSGVPIQEIDPNAAALPSILVLDQRDLDNQTPEEWTALSPRAVIATLDSQPVMPSAINWFNTHSPVWYEVTTDGESMWLKRSP